MHNEIVSEILIFEQNGRAIQGNNTNVGYRTKKRSWNPERLRQIGKSKHIIISDFLQSILAFDPKTPVDGKAIAAISKLSKKPTYQILLLLHIAQKIVHGLLRD